MTDSSTLVEMMMIYGTYYGRYLWRCCYVVMMVVGGACFLLEMTVTGMTND